MSALPDDPGHFVRWSGAAPDAFVPRAVYGMYLEALLTEAHARAAPGVTLQFVCGEAVSAAVDDGAVRIALREAREIQARASVLALGNLSGPDLAVPDGGLYASALYRRSPWERGALDGVPPRSGRPPPRQRPRHGGRRAGAAAARPPGENPRALAARSVAAGPRRCERARAAAHRRERRARPAPRLAGGDPPRGRLAPGIRCAPAGHAAHLVAPVGRGAATFPAPPADPLGGAPAPHGSRGRRRRRAAAGPRTAARARGPDAIVRGGRRVRCGAVPPARRAPVARAARGARGELHRSRLVPGRRAPPAGRIAARARARAARRAGDGLLHRPRRRATRRRPRPALHARRAEARRAVGDHRDPRAPLPGPHHRRAPGRRPRPPLRRASDDVNLNGVSRERGRNGSAGGCVFSERARARVLETHRTLPRSRISRAPLKRPSRSWPDRRCSARARVRLWSGR